MGTFYENRPLQITVSKPARAETLSEASEVCLMYTQLHGSENLLNISFKQTYPTNMVQHFLQRPEDQLSDITFTASACYTVHDGVGEVPQCCSSTRFYILHVRFISSLTYTT